MNRRHGGTGTLRSLLDALPVAVVLVEDGRITGWNPAAEVLYGWAASDTVGEALTDVLFEPSDADDTERILKEVAAGLPWDGDARVRRRDGVLLVSAFRAVPVVLPAGRAVAWMAADPLDQGLAEQERAVLLSAEHAARRTAEEALGLVEAVVGSAPVGIAVFDLDLRYVRVNDAYARLTGLPAEAHLGAYVGEAVPLPPEVAADLRKVVTTGRRVLDQEVAVEHPSGELRHFRVDYYPVQTTGGSLVGAGVTVVEVTAVRRAEQERAEMLARAEAARRRLAVLSTASAALATTMDLDQLLDRLARALAPAEADWCLLELFGEDGRTLRTSVASRDPERSERLRRTLVAAPLDRRGRGPVALALRTGRALLVTSGATDAVGQAAADRGLAHLPGTGPLTSAVVVPVRSGDRPIGVLVLLTEGTHVLGEDDLDLAVEVAHRAALAVGNARAYQREHEIAENLQRGLLPASLGSVPGLDVAVRYLPATEGALVGGDWYDVIAFDDGTGGLAVGDVVGHDIAAASAVGPLRTGLRVHADGGVDDPTEVLGRLDRLVEQLGLPMATALLAVVDPARPSVTWSSAGHLPPLLVREGRADYLSGGAGVVLGTGAGGLLGLSPPGSAELAAGDVLVLCTDGLVERRAETIDEGLERLAGAARGAEPLGVEGFCDEILARLLPEGEGRNDDVVLLAARVTG